MKVGATSDVKSSKKFITETGYLLIEVFLHRNLVELMLKMNSEDPL